MRVTPRGILKPGQGNQSFRLQRQYPCDNLAHLIEHYWHVSWHLAAGEEHLAETLPHPSVHIVVEPCVSEVVGIMRSRFMRKLSGTGYVFGIKFRPGAFHTFYREPVSLITDLRLDPAVLFGGSWVQVEKRIREREELAAMVRVTEDYLCELKPGLTEESVLAGRVVARIRTDFSILDVKTLAGTFGMSKRQLQRLFSTCIGVTPKWVIDRYRMHEALERLSAAQRPDLARVAHSLGYYDQSHFNRAFRKMTGVSPGAYSRS